MTLSRTYILAIDDVPTDLMTLGAVLEGEYELQFATSGPAGIALALQRPPDLILLDVLMPVMDGFATAAWLKKEHPEVLIMALSVQDDDDSLIRMIKAGARGYLHKNVHPAELEKALETLVNKGMYYPDWATSRVFLKMAANEESDHVTAIPISVREKEFLQLACTELTYKEIGEKMFCSPRTVESYRDSLFEKLGVKTRVALALYAVKTGLYKI